MNRQYAIYIVVCVLGVFLSLCNQVLADVPVSFNFKWNSNVKSDEYERLLVF